MSRAEPRGYAFAGIYDAELETKPGPGTLNWPHMLNLVNLPQNQAEFLETSNQTT